MVKFIKNKDWDNILKMIQGYHEEVITIKNPCRSCEFFRCFGCILNKCIKIRDGMVWLSLDQYDEPEIDYEVNETAEINQNIWNKLENW
jgi:hypothetical protein